MSWHPPGTKQIPGDLCLCRWQPCDSGGVSRCSGCANALTKMICICRCGGERECPGCCNCELMGEDLYPPENEE